MTFDEQVAALRGKVEPKQFRGGKGAATPEQWAAHLDDAVLYKRARAESSPEWRHRYREADRTYTREWKRKNAGRVREYKAARRKAGADAVREREYREKNRGRIRERYRSWCARARSTDVHYRLVKSVRGRLRVAVNGGYRSGSAVRDLGCSIEELKSHIERQWVGCMSWENWGSGPGTWQIDHVYPLAQTDLTDRAQLLAACNWRNLQPMWFEDNVRKGDTVTPEAQQLFDGLVSEFTEVRDEVA
jgi:hypothetical protein